MDSEGIMALLLDLWDRHPGLEPSTADLVKLGEIAESLPPAEASLFCELEVAFL